MSYPRKEKLDLLRKTVAFTKVDLAVNTKANVANTKANVTAFTKVKLAANNKRCDGRRLERLLKEKSR